VKIPEFSQARILLVGDVMLDSYWFGPATRISPEAPVPVVHVQRKEDRPGGAGNVALNLSSLGAQVKLISLTGDDLAADQLEGCLKTEKVECFFTRLAEHPTVNKLRILSKNQQLMRLDFETGFSEKHFHKIIEQFSKLIGDCNYVILSDYGKGTLPCCKKLIEIAQAHEVPVLVDPKGSDFERYRGASMITPNLSEFESVAGKCNSEEELFAKAKQIIQQFNLKSLLITRSEKGMSLVSENEQVTSIPTQAKEVYDVTGAGDTVIATMAASLASGATVDDAMQCANLAAGVVVGKLGTATATLDEIELALVQRNDSSVKVLSTQQLLEHVNKARFNGERIVMTNGCFDVLHVGHIRYLEQAKQLGSRLIVAVNSDRSVRQLKGKDRPISKLEDRMAILAALNFVDWVVSFDAETPEELICNVLPDVLVKGGDYNADEIAGGQCVRDKGGEIVILDYVEGKSTSNLIESIRSKD